jgi:hypothetical protein
LTQKQYFLIQNSNFIKYGEYILIEYANVHFMNDNLINDEKSQIPICHFLIAPKTIKNAPKPIKKCSNKHKFRNDVFCEK